MNQHHIYGFVKRAQDYGLTEGQAIDLYKQAFDLDDPRLLAGLAGGGIGAIGANVLSDDENENKGSNTLLGGLAGAGLGAGGMQLAGMHGASDLKDTLANLVKTQPGTKEQKEVFQGMMNSAIDELPFKTRLSAFGTHDLPGFTEWAIKNQRTLAENPIGVN